MTVSTMSRLFLSTALVAGLYAAPVMAQEQVALATAPVTTTKMSVTSTKPSAVAPRRITVTDKPVADIMPNAVYQAPRRTPDITADQILDRDSAGFSALASAKVRELSGDLFKLQGEVARLSDQALRMQTDSQEKAAEYYASVATINTQLQSGSTPGNPRLVAKLDTARQNLDSLSDAVSDFNGLAVEAAAKASVSSFILQNIRAAYALSGSTEEDHAQLAQLEDAVLGTTVVVERLLNNINDDIARSSAYLSAERSNLRTLSLAVSNGELYGRSLANRPFASVPQSDIAARMQNAGASFGGNMMMPAPTAGVLSAPAPVLLPGSLTGGPLTFNIEGTQDAMSSLTMPSGQPSEPRPLMTIRFDRENIAYQQPLYVAVNEAMSMYPNARFELVAVAPGQGNAARMALENSRSRRNAEEVLRALSQMGVPTDKVILSASSNPNSDTSEVQLYIR